MMRTLAVLALAAGLAACQDAGERSAAMLQPGDRFAVVRIDGAPAPDGVTLEVGADGRIAGRAPCNRYSARLTESGGAMAAGALVMTRMACSDPARTLAETRFGQAMGAVTAARRTGGGIALIDPEGRERLGLAPVADQ